MKYLASLIMILPLLLLTPISEARAGATFTSNSDYASNAIINEPIKNDAFLTGNTVSIEAPVDGEIFAAGNVVNVANQGSRSLYAAGSVVTIDQGSGYNAFVAGNTVILSGTYGHDVYAFGNTVTIKEGAVINGDLRVAGTSVSMAGTVKGDVYASGGTVTSSSVIGGNFSGDADTYAFSGGSIAGNLNYQSNDTAAGLDKVAVSGKTERTDPPKAKKDSQYPQIFGWLTSFFSALVLGALLIALMPKRISGRLEEVKNEWSGLALVGFALVILTPGAALLAFVTVIGWKVGLVILAIYAILLLCGNVIAAVLLGQLILERFKKSGSLWTGLLLGLATVSLLSAIPWIGWIASLLFFFGLVLPSVGSLARGIRRTATN